MLRDFAFSGAMEGCEIIESTEESHSEERNGIQEVEGSIPFGSTSPKNRPVTTQPRCHWLWVSGGLLQAKRICVTRSPLVTLFFSVPL